MTNDKIDEIVRKFLTDTPCIQYGGVPHTDNAIAREELRRALTTFADEIRKERVTHCDDINCPECSRVAYEAGVKAERELINREWISLNLRNDNEKNWSKELAKFGVFMQNLTTPREDNNKEV